MLLQLKPGQKTLKTFCYNRVFKQNRNVIILITGDTGTGKTLSAFRIALDLDLGPVFESKYITQDADNILKLFGEVARDKEKHKGRVYVYEELQEDMLNLNATTIEAKAIIKLFSKFRYLNGILIMTSPRGGHLNKLLMDYVDVHIATEQIFKRRKICRLKIKFGRWVENIQKMFWEFMRVQYVTGKDTTSDLFKLEFIDLKIPPKNIIDYYEGKKDNFFIDSMSREKRRIEKKYTRGKGAKKYRQECKECGFVWESYRDTVVKCSRCNRPMSKFNRKPYTHDGSN